MKKLMLLVVFGTFLAHCSDPDDDDNSGKQVSAVLQSTDLSGSGLRLADSVELTNVTGLADSVGLNFSTGNCGFNVWAADSQTSKSGLAGRTYEQFDLGDPVSWTSLGAGLQGEDCGTQTVAQVESYFVYMDLYIDVNNVEKVIRAYMGQQEPFEAGDIVLVDDDTLSWYDEDTEELVDSTSDRPDNPATFELSKEVPWYDNNGTEEIILMEFRINADSRDAYTVTENTGHVIVDIDFAESGISISDTSSDAAILGSVSLPFLDPSEVNNLLSASLTISEDRPADEEVAEE